MSSYHVKYWLAHGGNSKRIFKGEQLKLILTSNQCLSAGVNFTPQGLRSCLKWSNPQSLCRGLTSSPEEEMRWSVTSILSGFNYVVLAVSDETKSSPENSFLALRWCTYAQVSLYMWNENTRRKRIKSMNACLQSWRRCPLKERQGDSAHPRWSQAGPSKKGTSRGAWTWKAAPWASGCESWWAEYLARPPICCMSAEIVISGASA